jgi:hypothetical protein
MTIACFALAEAYFIGFGAAMGERRYVSDFGRCPARARVTLQELLPMLDFQHGVDPAWH